MSSQGDRQPFKVSPTQAPPRQVQPPQPRVPQVPQVTQQVESRPATREELLAWQCELLVEERETLRLGFKTMREMMLYIWITIIVGFLGLGGFAMMLSTMLDMAIRKSVLHY